MGQVGVVCMDNRNIFKQKMNKINDIKWDTKLDVSFDFVGCCGM